MRVFLLAVLGVMSGCSDDVAVAGNNRPYDPAQDHGSPMAADEQRRIALAKDMQRFIKGSEIEAVGPAHTTFGVLVRPCDTQFLERMAGISGLRERLRAAGFTKLFCTDGASENHQSDL